MAENAEGRNEADVTGEATPPANVEERLPPGEPLLSVLVRSMPSGILVEDEERHILYANDAFCEMFSETLTREELFGSGCDEVLSNAASLFSDPEGFVRRTEETLERRRPVSGEEFALADGRVFERDYVPVFVGEDYRGHLWHYRDVSERRQQERALAESEEHFRSLVGHGSDIIAVVEANGTIRYVSPSVGRLLGYEPEEMVGTGIFSYLRPEETRQISETFAERLSVPGVHEPVEFSARRKSGSWARLEVVSNNLLHDESVGALVMNARDVTRKREAEEALKESESRSRQLFEQSVDALFVHDEAGRLADCNARTERLLGYAREELLSMTVADLSCDVLSTEEKARKEREGGTLWQRAMKGEPGIFARGHEEEVRRKDGTIVPVEVRVGPIDYGGRRMILSAARDITGRKRAERALKESEARNRAIVEAYPDLMFRVSRNGEYLDFQTNDDNKLYVPREEIIGNNIRDTLPLDVAAEALRHLARALETGGMQFYEYQLPAPEGLRDFEARFVATDEEEALCIIRDVTRRKALEEALRERETLFRAIFEQTAVGISTADLQRRILTANAAYQEMTGYSEEELIGRPLADISHPDDVPADDELNRELLSGGMDRYQKEKRYIRKDGEIIWVNPTVSVVRDAEERPQFLVGVVEDITERKQAEERLRESEERFRQLFEQSVDTLIVHDEEGRILDCNSEACRTLVYTREELLSLRIKDIANGLLSEEEKREREKAGGTLWQRVVRGESIPPVVVHYGEHIRKDGTTFPIEVHVGSVDYEGRRRILASVHDITERREAERRLQESEQRYRSLFDHNPDAVYSVDLEGKFLTANAACEKVAGYTAEELLRMSFIPLIVPEDLERTLQGFERAASGEPQNYEIAITHKDEHRVELNVTNLPILVAGEIVGVYGIAKDITERKRAEEARSRLAAIVESSDDAILGNTLEGVITSWNPGAEKLYGYSADEILGEHISILFPPERQCEVPRVLRRTGRTAEINSYETVRMAKDGRRIDVSVTASPVRDSSGNIIGTSAIVRDITDRKKAEEDLRRSEERYRAVVERTTDGIFLGDFETMRVLESNVALQNMLGYTSEELRGLKIAELIADDPETVEHNTRRILEDKSYLIGERCYRRKDGSLVDVESSATLSPYGDRVASCCIVRDITERKRAEEKLRKSEARNRAMIEATPDLIFLYSRDGEYLDLQANTPGKLYLPREELLGRKLQDALPPEVADPFVREIDRTLDTGEMQVYEYQLDVPEGALDFEARLVVSGPEEVLCAVRDITERKDLERQLSYQAFHDSLTGLPNRPLFMEHLKRALARTRRQGNEVAVLFMDIDNFKYVNDRLGHEVGDQLLISVAKRLREAVRPGDTVARLGGDELTVLLEEVADAREATQVAERIERGLQTPLTLEGHEVFVGASIGIALSSSAHDQPERLLSHADLAMYRAKNKGKAQHAVFTPGMETVTSNRLQLANELRRAVDQGEMRVCYQPKVRLSTDLQQQEPKVVQEGRVVGMEALVRWEHPELGTVGPKDFITTAEETGLILPIGHRVLEEACRQARAWQEQYPARPPLVMCVNLSARQFQQPELAQNIARMLQEIGLDPRCLELEITESVVMEEVESTLNILGELRDLGVRLAIDDFGTGYSSLSYLKRFSVDSLKIDRSFVEGVEKDSENAVIVSGIITLAHTLGIQVTAEGVETADQAAHLRQIGCDLAQGNHFSKPLPGEGAGELLARNQSTHS